MSYIAKIYKIWDSKNKDNTTKIIGSKSTSLKDLLYNSKRTYGFDKIEYEVLKTWRVNHKKEINDVVREYEDKLKEDRILTDKDIKACDDLPSNLIKFIDDNSKESTAKIYKSQLRKFCMFCNGGKMNFHYSYFHDLRKIQDYIDSLGTSVQSQFSCAILVAKRLLHEYEMKEIEQMNRNISSRQQTKKIEDLKTPKVPLITVEKIKEVAEQMKGNDLNSLVAYLYAYEAPLRCDTWTRTRLGENVKDDTENNYINLDTGILHLNQYKTVKTYGNKEYKLDNRIIDKIKAFHKDKDTNELLPKITPNNLTTKILKKIFGCGCNGIRHSYVTNCMKKYGANSKELSDLCYRMNTSMITGVLTYNDNDFLKDKDD